VLTPNLWKFITRQAQVKTETSASLSEFYGYLIETSHQHVYLRQGFQSNSQQDREDFGGVDNPVIDKDYTGSDLQVLVEEHIEAAV
jgi:hypothetical protein